MSLPDFAHEAAAMAAGAARIAGVDEVGRGPLAGPVIAAAVVLPSAEAPPGLNDSKKLSAATRDRLADWVQAHCDWAIGECSVQEIDDLNIYHAAHLAMCRAVAGLRAAPDLALIDGNKVPRGLAVPGQAIVKGDARSLSIAAASVLAKVWRDRIMVDLAQQHPGYGWDVNAGYPTPAHKKALLDIGVTPHHRRSFKPVHNILCRG